MKTVPPKTLEDNGSFLKFTIAHVTDVTTMGPLWNIESNWRPTVHAFPELLPGETRLLWTRPPLLRNFRQCSWATSPTACIVL
jgi:hypothetical protein